MEMDTVIAVRELCDRAAITEALHAYARFVDERDFAAVAGVFRDDCLAEYGLRDSDILHSSAAVVDWLSQQLAHGMTTSHHISNVHICFTDADHADTTSYVYAWHGEEGSSAGAPVILARYVDQFERTRAGWRIAHRQMLAHGLIGFPEGIVRPLARRE